MATLLQMAERVCRRIGINIPATVIGNSDQDVQMLLEAFHAEGEFLRDEYDFPELTKEHTFTSSNSAQAQSGGLPSDFLRFAEPVTVTNRTDSEVIWGSTERDWQFREISGASSSITYYWMVRGEDFLLGPTAPNAKTIAFSYITENWCEDSGGTGQTVFAADTDVTDLPDDLLISGAVWRWREMKGFDFSVPYQNHMQKVMSRFTAKKGAPVLQYANRPAALGVGSIPDGNFPGS